MHSLLESSSQDFEALTQRYQQLVTVNKSSIPNDIYDEMASLVHRIKGGVQLIDAHELVDSCIKFESLLHTHNKSAIIAHGVEYLALLAETHQLLIELVATYTKIGSSDSVK